MKKVEHAPPRKNIGMIIEEEVEQNLLCSRYLLVKKAHFYFPAENNIHILSMVENGSQSFNKF